MKNNIITLLKGLWIGGTMTVPGVSGGTMAMVLDVYDRVIGAVASFRKNVRENLRFLLWFAAGGAIGFFVFAAYLLKPLTDAFPTQTQFFFIGAVAGGAPKGPALKMFPAPCWGRYLYCLLPVFRKGCLPPKAVLP